MAREIVIPSFVLILLCVGFYTWSLHRVLRREVEPTRRRDLTLAGAGGFEAFNRRAEPKFQRMLLPIMGVGLVGGVVTLLESLEFLRIAQAGLLFAHCLIIVWFYSLLASTGVRVFLFWIAGSTCRRNERISQLAWPLGFAVGVAYPAPLILGGAGYLLYLEDGGSAGLLGAMLEILVIVLAYGVYFSISYIKLPAKAYDRLIHAYEYRE
jgi:hypothetical protein